MDWRRVCAARLHPPHVQKMSTEEGAQRNTSAGHFDLVTLDQPPIHASSALKRPAACRACRGAVGRAHKG